MRDKFCGRSRNSCSGTPEKSYYCTVKWHAVINRKTFGEGYPVDSYSIHSSYLEYRHGRHGLRLFLFIMIMIYCTYNCINLMWPILIYYLFSLSLLNVYNISLFGLQVANYDKFFLFVKGDYAWETCYSIVFLVFCFKKYFGFLVWTRTDSKKCFKCKSHLDVYRIL